jgi:hypothetical protein
LVCEAKGDRFKVYGSWFKADREPYISNPEPRKLATITIAWWSLR